MPIKTACRSYGADVQSIFTASLPALSCGTKATLNATAHLSLKVVSLPFSVMSVAVMN